MQRGKGALIYLGICMIAIAFAYALYEFSERIKVENAVYDAIISVLVHIRKKMPLGMQILPRMLSDFEARSEQEKRIVDVLVNDIAGAKSSRATLLADPEIGIKEEDRERFVKYFSDFASNELECECKRLDDAIQYFECRRSQTREQSDKKVKSYTVLFITALSGALILAV